MVVKYIRHKVSKKKRRYITNRSTSLICDNGNTYDLDLTYIGGTGTKGGDDNDGVSDNSNHNSNARIIAMGYPSTGVESLYRNRLSEVRKFLNARHAGHYKVYNLCSEPNRRYTAEEFFGDGKRSSSRRSSSSIRAAIKGNSSIRSSNSDIDSARHAARLASYPFDDHNVPPFEMLCDLLEDIEEWLNADEKNVAVVHCKAGKGRTGLVVSAHLLHMGDYSDATGSLNKFASDRTHNLSGVTIPSQRRYVHYYERYLIESSRSRDEVASSSPLKLERVVLTGEAIPKFHSVTIICVSLEQTYKLKGWAKHRTNKDGAGITRISKIIGGNASTILLDKDFHMSFDRKSMHKPISGAGNKRIFGGWFNTKFLNGKYLLKVKESELDGIVTYKKEMKTKLLSNFTLELHFSKQQQPKL